MKGKPSATLIEAGKSKKQKYSKFVHILRLRFVQNGTAVKISKNAGFLPLTEIRYNNGKLNQQIIFWN